MSSTKRKSLAIAVLALLVVGIAMIALLQLVLDRHTSSDLRGSWEGSLQVQNSSLRLVLKVDRAPDGSYTATIDSIDQGAMDIPVDTLSFSNDVVRAELARLRASYHARLSARADEMSGQWSQNGMTFPLILKRTTNPSTIAAPLPDNAYARSHDSLLQGWWKGTITAGGTPLRIVFKVAAVSPGNYQGTLDSIDQGAKNIPLSSIEYIEPTVRMDVESIDGHFEGTLTKDGSGIDGNWTQAGRDFRLALQRAEPSEEKLLDESAYAFASTNELQGIWNGALDVNGTRLRLVLKIARTAADTYSVLMDSPDQGAKDIPATTVTFQDSAVQVEWKALRALFHGRLEGGKLIGFWQQGASDFPLDFERTNRAARAAERPGNELPQPR
jgi:hypothetical protein